MERESKQRVAANEARFREVNEGIARGRWPGEEDVPAGFRCECARLGCTELIELTLREYERVRAHPRRFILLAAHDVPEAERIVETRPGYVVVEKVGEAAGVAEVTDPRD
jgi:hypothetical protein